jgi:hypothetical protein
MSKHDPIQLPVRIQIAALIFSRRVGPTREYNSVADMAASALEDADVFVAVLMREAERKKLSAAETEKIARK